MYTVFSGKIYIKKITKIDGVKWYGEGECLATTYNLQGNYYDWLKPEITIFGYGFLNSNKNTVYLETIIPDLIADSNLFKSFLLYSQIPGLSSKKINLLFEKYGESLYILFSQGKFDLINQVLNYESEKIAVVEEKWRQINVYCLLHIKLMKLGLSAKYVRKIYKIYKEESFNVVSKNPYQMIESVGFGFKTVDAIAKEVGITDADPVRIQGAIAYIIEQNQLLGNTYIEKASLYNQLKKLLLIYDENLFDDCCHKLFLAKKIISKDDRYIGKTEIYYYELFIVNFFKNKKIIYDVDFKFDLPFSLSEEQCQSVKNAISYNYTVITGRAGTGKSTVIRAIYYIQSKYNKRVLVITPTGRASQRIKEIDQKINAMTIYKALTPQMIYSILKNEKTLINYLPYDHIIIDESSMIDSVLLYVILKMIGNNTSITFLGDVFQLPPIGMGSPFELLIQFNYILVSCLTKIYRQNEKSGLLSIAQDVSLGVYPKISKNKLSICCFMSIEKESLYSYLINLLDEYYDKKSHIISLQFITFLNRGLCGVDKLNIFIQDYLYKKYKKQEPLLLYRFYKNDKVVVIKNNYNLDVRNGEIGFVIGGSESELVVHFSNDKVVTFSSQESGLLNLAYVINVYKSQGSEFKNVGIILYMEQYILLNKKALYTALTRAKEKSIIVGERKALYCVIKNNNENRRKTFLELFLIDRKEN